MRCRTRNARALRCKRDGWLPSWDSLTRLLQTLIVPEWRQSGQPADVSLQSIGFTGRETDAGQRQRQPRISTDRHGSDLGQEAKATVTTEARRTRRRSGQKSKEIATADLHGSH